jgi:hypothetical protein
MAQDISAELAVTISEATGGGGKPFIRHTKYSEFLLTRCHSKRVKMEDTKWHRFSFMEFKVLKAVPHEKGAIPTSLQSRDDGTNPNPVGSMCSHSIDFDGNGAAMAGQNVKEFIAGLFGVDVDQLSKEDGFQTWVDLCRKMDVKAGGVDYVDPNTQQPVLAKKDKVANMGCGFIIALSTSAKELKETRKVKDLTPEQRKYFTQKNWQCLARPGTGINSPEDVAKRRAQVLLDVPMGDEEEESDDSLADAGAAAAAANGVVGSNGSVPTPPSTAPTPPALTASTPTPPIPVDPNWPPKAPWEGPSASQPWLTKDGKTFVWSNPNNGGNNSVMTEAEYRAGRR